MFYKHITTVAMTKDKDRLMLQKMNSMTSLYARRQQQWVQNGHMCYLLTINGVSQKAESFQMISYKVW